MKVNIPKEGKPTIKIDPWDIWSCDDTIATIVHPLLVKFRDNINGHPIGLSPKKWRKIVDEMIYAFEFYAKGDHYIVNCPEKRKPVKRGLKLFAQYFEAIWT